MNTRLCKNCKAFNALSVPAPKDSVVHDGLCRRHAPTISFSEEKEEDDEGTWPIVDNDDWCMEFIDRGV